MCPFGDHFWCLWYEAFDFFSLQGSLLWGVRNPLHYAILPASGMEQSELLYKSWLKGYTRNFWQLLAAFSVWRNVCCHRPWGAEEEGSRNQSSVKLTAGIWKYHAEVVSLLPLFFSIFFFLRSLKFLIISSQKNKKVS